MRILALNLFSRSNKRISQTPHTNPVSFNGWVDKMKEVPLAVHGDRRRLYKYVTCGTQTSLELQADNEESRRIILQHSGVGYGNCFQDRSGTYVIEGEATPAREIRVEAVNKYWEDAVGKDESIELYESDGTKSPISADQYNRLSKKLQARAEEFIANAEKFKKAGAECQEEAIHFKEEAIKIKKKEKEEAKRRKLAELDEQIQATQNLLNKLIAQQKSLTGSDE